MALFYRPNMSSYSIDDVPMYTCIISDIKRNIGRNLDFFHTPPTFDAAVRGGGPLRPNIAITFGMGMMGNLEWWGYSW